MLFKVIIFVCAAGISPQSCDNDTAIRVIRAEPASNEMMCGFNAQAQLAETSLNAGEDVYMKIVCKRDKPLKSAAKLQ